MELPITVPLKVPVEYAGKKYTELVFKHPCTVDAMREFPLSDTKMKVGDFVPVIASMCDIPTGVVAALWFSDFRACAEIVMRFFQDAEGD